MANWRNTILAATAMLAVGGAAQAADRLVPAGSISIDETQFGFLLGGNTGGGRLTFKGKTYRFDIGGISVGDLGVTKVRGGGTVYNMTDIAQFAGTYTKLDASATLVEGSGALRLKNDQGVILDISTRSKGLQLSAGAGGVKVSLKE